jgi:hypothetical protein
MDESKPPPGWGKPRIIDDDSIDFACGDGRVWEIKRDMQRAVMPFDESGETDIIVLAHEISRIEAQPFVDEALAKQRAEIVAELRRLAQEKREWGDRNDAEGMAADADDFYTACSAIGGAARVIERGERKARK